MSNCQNKINISESARNIAHVNLKVEPRDTKEPCRTDLDLEKRGGPEETSGKDLEGPTHGEEGLSGPGAPMSPCGSRASNATADMDPEH